MSSTITFRVFPPEGNVFLPGAFDSSIGRPVKLGDRAGILRAADITEGGAYALVTVEAPEAGAIFGEALLGSISRD